MHPRLVQDLTTLPALLESTRAVAERVLTGIAERPVALPSSSVDADPAPTDGVGLAGALARFAERWEPQLSGSAGPRYLGFVTGGSTPASVAGDWLTSAFDQNTADGETAAGELERETLGWLRDAVGLSDAYSGSFVTGATMSNFVGLAIGREWLGERQGVSVSQDGVQALGKVEVLSGTPHSSIYKALSMLGVGRRQVQVIPVMADREAVDVARLRDALEALGGRPAIVVANAGTVNTVDFDDLRAIADLKQQYPFWLHVDAAFGGLAALSPKYAHLLDGLDEADSVCIDLHKWLNVPYDSAVQFTRRRDLQVRVFHNSASYLGEPDGSRDFLHLTPENSRRFRALAAWFTLTAYGLAGHRDIVERNSASARRFGDAVSQIPGVRLLAPVRLNVVCFSVPGDPAEVASALAATGEAFMTTTVYQGVPAFRAAFSNWRTEKTDEDRVVNALRAVLGG